MTLISVEELERALNLLKEWRSSVQSEIVLPWPPSVNSYWRTHQGRMLISAEGRSYRAVVADQILLQGFRQNKTYENKIVVQIQAYRPDERKRDLDNLLKAPLDALAKAGVYKDDSQIVDLRIFWAKEKGGMLKILISEVNDAHSD